MIMVDRNGQMVMVNSTTETLFGYNREELLGQPIELLVPDRVRDRHVADRDAYFQNPVTRPMGVGRDLAGRRKDGSELPVEVALNAVDVPRLAGAGCRRRHYASQTGGGRGAAGSRRA